MKKPLLITFAALSLPASSETIYTIPQGYTKVTIAGAPSIGATSLTALSVTLLNDTAFAGSTTIDSGSFNADPDGDPDTQDGTQEINVPGVTWTAGQWTSSPHVVYVADGNGGEQAFLISSHNTSGEITLITTFNLTSLVDHDKDAGTADVPRFPASTTVKIRPANTLQSIFADQISDFASDDRIFVWTGSNWNSFLKNGFGNWAPTTNSFGNANNTVIFPDEGMFILRSATSVINLTFFGEVPAVKQIANIEKQAFLSNRVPIDTTLSGLGLNNSDWQSDDRVFVWDGTSWVGYLVNGFGNWAPVTNSFGNSNDLVISANSAVFVTREAAIADSADASVITPLNYDPLSE
jgi:hypothetical protein